MLIPLISQSNTVDLTQAISGNIFRSTLLHSATERKEVKGIIEPAGMSDFQYNNFCRLFDELKREDKVLVYSISPFACLYLLYNQGFNARSSFGFMIIFSDYLDAKSYQRNPIRALAPGKTQGFNQLMATPPTAQHRPISFGSSGAGRRNMTPPMNQFGTRPVDRMSLERKAKTPIYAPVKQSSARLPMSVGNSRVPTPGQAMLSMRPNKFMSSPNETHFNMIQFQQGLQQLPSRSAQSTPHIPRRTNMSPYQQRMASYQFSSPRASGMNSNSMMLSSPRMNTAMSSPYVRSQSNPPPGYFSQSPRPFVNQVVMQQRSPMNQLSASRMQPMRDMRPGMTPQLGMQQEFQLRNQQLQMNLMNAQMQAMAGGSSKKKKKKKKKSKTQKALEAQVELKSLSSFVRW
jgi:hypothetical protein